MFHHFHHFYNGPFSFQVRIGPFLSYGFCHTGTPVACSLNSPEAENWCTMFELNENFVQHFDYQFAPMNRGPGESPHMVLVPNDPGSAVKKGP